VVLDEGQVLDKPGAAWGLGGKFTAKNEYENDRIKGHLMAPVRRLSALSAIISMWSERKRRILF
jgi:hypothetical protein